MKTYPVVLTIAGSDSGGGAGIQADIKTMSALGAFATSAITAITVQNTLGVTGIHDIPCEMVADQIEAVLSDFPVRAIKIGMINKPELVEVITSAIRKHKIKHVVLDPVMVATAGGKLMQEPTVEKMKKELFPCSTIITPNLYETGVLLNRKITSLEEMEAAAKELGELGCTSVLVKGGHLFESEAEMVDVLWMSKEQEIHTFSAPKINTKNLHGTGCSLSSAIATFLALGNSIPESVDLAKDYITAAIEAGKDVSIGKGNGAVNHFANPVKLKIIQNN